MASDGKGGVVRNCLELGYLGWPNFEGVWKGSVWGFFTGESSLKVARDTCAQCKDSPLDPPKPCGKIQTVLRE